jgi:hypothetical protein
MWWYFVKLNQTKDIVIYSYGYESKELTGVFEYNRKTQETKIIKFATNDSESVQKVFPIPAYRLVVKYGAPDERIVAIG